MLSDRPLPGFDATNCIGYQYLTRIDNLGWDGEVEDEPEDAELQYDLFYSEIEDLLRTLCQPFFQELARATADEHQRKSLYAHMNPHTFNLQLETLAGKPKIVKRDDIPQVVFHPALPGTTIISPDIPPFSPRSIEILELLAYTWVLKVQLNGEVMVCKLTNQSGHHDSLAREYTSLQRILDANIASHIKVPKLRGVRSENGGVVGVLLDYIQPAVPNLGIALSAGDIEKSRREKWASQIETPLEQLHSIGVIWSDAKDSNILIDERDDGWILGFGGGQTIGWVETELVGTKEGDLQALEKILGSLRG
jgi:serine/threonine protein kinase